MEFLGVTANIAIIRLGRPVDYGYAVVEPAQNSGGGVWAAEASSGGWRVFHAGAELFWFSVAESSAPIRFKQSLEEGDRVYGFGEKYARLNRRYKRFNMWNVDQPYNQPSADPSYASIPLYIVFSSKRCYAVYFDYAGYTGFNVDIDRRGELNVEVDSEGVKVYVLWGETIREVVAAIYTLFGGFTLPPKWALGYHQSRYSYMSQEEVLEVASTLRRRGIPCDAIWLDIHYMDGYTNFTWNKDGFPSPKQMIKGIHDMGFKLVTIVDVGLPKKVGYRGYDLLEEVDGFIKHKEGGEFLGVVWPGVCVFPDFVRTQVRQRWAQLIADWLTQGVDGIWLDMNEPSIFLMVQKAAQQLRELCDNVDDGESIGVKLASIPKLNTVGLYKGERMVPIDGVHTTDSGGRLPHTQVHNAYPLLEAWATHEGFKAHNADKRWFILTRAGFPGIQRYAALWTGDNQADWGEMEMSIPQLLTLSLCGLPFVGSDVGGFGDDADPELMVRWTQLGAFYPFFRNHSSKDSNRREPWVYGEEYERPITDAIRLRYRFLPQIYKLFRQAESGKQPVIRPLVYEFPHDESTWDLDSEFLVGSNLLVAPITQPGVRARSVYLPSGPRWLDYWTRKVYSGGRWVLVDAPLTRIPLFVRENTTLVVSEAQHVNAHNWKPVIEAFVESQADAELYDDDGSTLAYRRGEFFQLDAHFERRGDTLTITTRKTSMAYTPEYTSVGVQLLRAEGIERIRLDTQTVDMNTPDTRPTIHL
ncbi:MAG: glycoside hydrolase family 31 protein [Thermoprotei archaeon]